MGQQLSKSVDFEGHGNIAIVKRAPINWYRYSNIYPERYMHISPEITAAIIKVCSILNIDDLKAARTLEIGSNSESLCAFALDSNVTCYNSENINWEQLKNENKFDAIIILNAISYLTQEQLNLALSKTDIFVANAPYEMPNESIRDNECCTRIGTIMHHELLLEDDTLMYHTFFARNAIQYKDFGLTVTKYGNNSALITKGI